MTVVPKEGLRSSIDQNWSVPESKQVSWQAMQSDGEKNKVPPMQPEVNEQ